MSNEAMKMALEALELAQDNLRDHGDNCFLHDEGQYNRCFCGKDSLSNYLQEAVEKLDTAIKQALAAPVQEPMRPEIKKLYEDYFDKCFRDSYSPQRTWVGLTDKELEEFSDAELGSYDLCLEVEAKLKDKNNAN
jgi:hypothetical protein